MSGGEYDYAYMHIERLADAIEAHNPDALRKKFVKHLRLVAQAARDIEWEDSGDGADWKTSVRKVLRYEQEKEKKKI